MSLLDEQFAFVGDVLKLIKKALEMGYDISFGEVQRPLEMQTLYVQTGRSKTMDSEHVRRCAIDLNIFKARRLCSRDEIKPLGDYWESLSPKNRWGGNWRGLVDLGKSDFIDAPHFERRGSA